ncbi:MAG: MFS transporter [Puniceicoccales bacterium]
MHLREASPRRLKWATAGTFLILPISGVLTDIYLPSFPAMAGNLGVTQASVQLTLTCFLFSYGICQLFVGSLLDRFGRRPLVLASLVTVILSSLVIAWSHSIAMICAMRILQGTATAFIVVAKRAYVVDVYDGEERKHYLSYYTIVWSCGPILAPFLGGYLEKAFHWQANFYFIAGFSLFAFFWELLIGGETVRQRKPLKPRAVARDYSTLLTHRDFMTGTIILGLSYGVVMIFNLSGPFVLEDQWHYSSVTIGYCTLGLGIAWMSGGILGKQLVKRDFNTKITLAVFAQIALVLGLMLASLRFDNLFLLVGCVFPTVVCSGFLFTNYFGHSMLLFPEHAGIAGGLAGGLLYLVTSLIGFIVPLAKHATSLFDLSVQYAILVGLLAAVVLNSIRRNLLPSSR